VTAGTAPLPSLPGGLILGHRGASADAPENTLRAFRLAIEQGADGIEFDVQPSADGVPVVIHDDTVDRTTRGSGMVAALTWSALAALDAGGGEPVPCLDDVAAWAGGAGAWLNIELKAPGVEAASVEVLRRHGLLGRTVFSSFDPAVVAAVGRVAPASRRFLLTVAWNAATREALGACGAGGVCLQDRAATAATLRELAGHGLPVVVWTVDDPLRMEQLLRAGVAAVISNYPARAAAVRRALPPGAARPAAF
jgi:glycerophosphoryl diester phosphodiesterase